MNLLAFDYGASSGRGILGRYNGSVLDMLEISRIPNGPIQLGARLYWDFPALFSSLKTALSLASKHGEVASVAVDTWGVDFGLIDRYGLLMSNPFHYRDTFTEGYMEKFFEKIPKKELYEKTGTQFMRINTLYQLFAVKELYPELFERIHKILLMPNLFDYFLTGEYVCEYTIASTTQMLNACTKDWDKDIISSIGLKESALPEITMPGYVIGALTSDLREELAMDTKVVSACAHDTASAILAAPMHRNEVSAYLSCGTWSLLGVELTEPLTHQNAFEAGYTNEGGYGNTIRFLKNITGQWVSMELKREYENENGPISFMELDELEEESPAFGPLIDMFRPEFQSPGGMKKKIRDYCVKTGQTPPETIGAFMRCVTESLALTYRNAIETLESVLGYSIPFLRVVGGGGKNKNLMKATASALGRPVCAGPYEATAIGNFCGQLLAFGELSSISEARALVAESFNVQTYAPSKTGAWDELYGKYLNLLKREDI